MFLTRIQLDFSHEMREYLLSLGAKCPINISNHAQGAASFIGLKYSGDADVALSSGNTPTGDYTSACHALIYSRSPYADGAQKYKGLKSFLDLHRQAGDNFVVLEEGDSIDADCRNYSNVLDPSMKKWGLLSDMQGLVEDRRLVSDTGELEFDFEKGIFHINTPQLKTASGNIKGKVVLGKYTFEVKNDKMTLSLLSLDGKETDFSEHLLLVMLGWCGNLDTVFEKQSDGSRIMRDSGHGPVSIDTFEGTVETPGNMQIYPLKPDGSPMNKLEGGPAFKLMGEGTMYFEPKCR